MKPVEVDWNTLISASLIITLVSISLSIATLSASVVSRLSVSRVPPLI